MTTETAPATSEKMLDNRDLMRMYWRSTFLLGSFNFERMQAMGFCYTLMPAIRKVYRGDKAAEAAALKRHLEFYNTHPLGLLRHLRRHRRHGGAEVQGRGHW